MMEYKGYNIVSDGTYGHKNIKTVGRGSLPNALSGSFTSTPIAQKAIDSYVNVKKGENDGEERISD